MPEKRKNFRRSPRNDERANQQPFPGMSMRRKDTQQLHASYIVFEKRKIGLPGIFEFRRRGSCNWCCTRKGRFRFLASSQACWRPPR